MQRRASSYVTLYVRVWIETVIRYYRPLAACVTLYVRVWIETSVIVCKLLFIWSPST